MLFQKLLGGVIIGNIQKMPVIQSGTFELFVIDRKSHRSNQMQPCPCAGTGSCNVSGVLWYLRLKQYNVEPWIFFTQLHFPLSKIACNTTLSSTACYIFVTVVIFFILINLTSFVNQNAPIVVVQYSFQCIHKLFSLLQLIFVCGNSMLLL